MHTYTSGLISKVVVPHQTYAMHLLEPTEAVWVVQYNLADNHLK